MDEALEGSEAAFLAGGTALPYLGTLLDLAPVGLIVRTFGTDEIIYWSGGAEALYGWSTAEALGQITHSLLSTRFPESKEAVDDALEQDGQWAGELVHTCRNGEQVVVASRQTVQRDAQSRPTATLEINTDITERKRSEEGLRASEYQAEEARARASREEDARAAAEAVQADLRTSRDELVAILSGVGEGITVLDASGRMLFANDAAARLCGFANGAEMRSAPPSRILEAFDIFDEHGARFPRERLPGQLALRGETPAEVMIRFRVRANGEERWSVVNATPIRDQAGQVTMEVSIFHDITERKHAEDTARFMAAVNLELSRSLDYEQTLARVAELTVPLLADWCIVYMIENDGSLRRLAMAHSDPEKTRRAQELSELYPADPDAPSGPAQVMRTGAPTIVSEVDVSQLEASVPSDGHLELLRLMQLSSYITVPLVARGRTLGAITVAAAESGREYGPRDVAVIEDLAARAGLAVDNARLYREAQEQAAVHVELNTALRDAMAQLHQALQTRDEFIASASHDLKTPVASIKSAAQLLQRRLVRGHLEPEQLLQSLERIDQIATRAADQVDELLDIARLQMGGGLDLDRRNVELVALVADVVAEYQSRSDRHEIRFEAGQAETTGFWDDRRLRRVLCNLIDNALKYSPDGGLIDVRVRVEDGYAVLTVDDQGMGIPDGELESIFDRFQRGTNVLGQIPGTGVGLASARHIVESHGGSISAARRAPQGASFTLTLPLA